MAARDYELLLKISADIRNAVGPLNKLSRELRQSGKTGNAAFDRVNRSLEKIGRQARSVKGLLAGAFAVVGVKNLVGDVVDANVALQKIHFGLQQAFGSSKAADREFQFLAATSNKLGLNLVDAADGYKDLAASAQGTGLKSQQLQQFFTGLSEASSVLHLRSENLNGILIQLSQGLSLGKLQMQDLRAVAQHLPGTFSILSQAFKQNGQDLKKLLKEGGLPAQQTLELLGRALHERFGAQAKEASHSLQAELNRLHTTIFQLQNNASQGGFLTSFTHSVRELTNTLRDPAVQQGFGAFLTGLGNLITFALKGIAAISGLAKAVSDALSQDKGKSYLGKLSEYRDLVDRIDALQKKLEQRKKTGGGPASGLLVSSGAYGVVANQAAVDSTQTTDQLQQEITQLQNHRDQLLKSITAERKALNKSGEVKLPPIEPINFPPLTDPKAASRARKQAAALQQLANVISGLGTKSLGPVSKLWNDYSTAVRRASVAGGKAIANGANAAYVQQQVAKAVNLANQARLEGLAKIRAGLQLDLYKATGNTAKATRIQLEQQYGKLEQDLLAQGDQTGAALVRKLFNVKAARTQLQTLFDQVGRIQADQQRQAANIQAEQSAGLILDYTAQKRLLELRQRAAAQLEQLLPLLRQAANATGDQAAIARVKDLSAEVGRLKLKVNDLKNAFNSGLTSGLEDALQGLATRTYTLLGALRAVARSILSSLTQAAAKALSAKLINAFSGNKDPGKQVGQGAEKLGLASLLLGFNADKLMAAAQALLVANAAGSFAGGGLISFASGGMIIGPGTGTSDSIPAMVSNGEFVQRAAAVDYYGASFMHALNNMQVPKYASGGMVGADQLPQRRPVMQRPAPAAKPGAAPAQPFRIVNVVDPELVGSYLRSGAGRDAVLNIISENRSTVRQNIGA